MRIVPALALLLVATPVAAQDAAQPAAPAAPVKEKKICRSVMSTGTILAGKRECHTKAEWSNIEQANKKNADAMVERARLTNSANRAQ